jgi:cation diffusion facilitator CzcD-associated flavoprotein CzcO
MKDYSDKFLIVGAGLCGLGAAEALMGAQMHVSLLPGIKS